MTERTPGRSFVPPYGYSSWLNKALAFLGLIGVIVDPTTARIKDSERAMGYEEPWEDAEK